MMMPHDKFREFTDPHNQVCQLLQAHFMALQLIMKPITNVELEEKQRHMPLSADSTPERWLGTLHKQVPTHMLQYYEWTLWVEKTMRSGELFG